MYCVDFQSNWGLCLIFDTESRLKRGVMFEAEALERVVGIDYHVCVCV